MGLDKHIKNKKVVSELDDFIGTLNFSGVINLCLVHEDYYSVITITGKGKTVKQIGDLTRLSFPKHKVVIKNKCITVHHTSVQDDVRSPAEQILDKNPSLILETVLQDIDR